ncbi:MAG: AI-2E family transporter [Nanohaloarchaea archaeon]|nr:AI-2E family transporter [Candidatus Nanohaloarchaea archaeon]
MNEQKGFLIVLTGLLAAISFLMLQPFMGYFLGAALLAFILHPVQVRWRKYLGSTISSLLIVFLAIFVIVAPFLFTATAVIDDAQDLAGDVRQSDLINSTQIENKIHELTGQRLDVEKNVERAVDRFTNLTLGNFSQLLSLIANASIGLTVMLFLLYYMLKDGEMLVKWLNSLIPLPEEITRNLHSKMSKTTWAVIKGHVLVAIIQGLVAGLGLMATGVPNSVFWTFVMILLGFIPIIGTILVWLPASVYLFLVDKPLMGVLLALYGFVIVGLTDNIIRPLAVERGADLHPAVIIIGVLGGVYIFGAVGLFIGPIILGIFKSVLVVFEKHYKSL